MSQTITISDSLYTKLKNTTSKYGLDSIEHLLEVWQASQEEVYGREKTIRQIDTLRERMFTKYGEMADSVELVREDRQR